MVISKVKKQVPFSLFSVLMSYLTNFSFFSDSAFELTRVCIKNNKLDAGTKSEYLHILEFAMILNLFLYHIINLWQVDLAV